MMVSLKPDGSMDREIIASGKRCKSQLEDEKEYSYLKKGIFCESISSDVKLYHH